MLANQLIMIVEPGRRFVLTPDSEIDIGDPSVPLSWEVRVTQTPRGPSFHIEFEAVEDEAKGGKTVFAQAEAG